MTTPTLRTLHSGPGPEDLDIIDWKGRSALLTATYSRAAFPKKPHPKPHVGSLEVYVPGYAPDGQGSGFQPVKVSGKPPVQFKPVGLSVVRQSLAPGLGGRQLAYVTNADPGPGLFAKGGSVEVYEVDNDRIEHLATLGGGPSKLLHKINGIAASRDGTVYVTTFGSLPGRALDTNLLEPDSPAGQTRTINSIVCFTPDKADATKGRWGVVATGISGANGLALSPGETLLYCNAYHRREILAFQRGEEAGGRLLKSHGAVYKGLPFNPDNLKGLPTGELWCTGQRSFLNTGLHLVSGARLPARGGVTKLHWDAGKFELKKDAEWVEEIADDTHAPSVAIPLGDAIYLGHIVDSGVTEVRPVLTKHKETPTPTQAPTPATTRSRN